MQNPTSLSQPLVVGVDLGGTKILAAVVDPEGNISGRAKLATMREVGPQGVTDRIAEAISIALAEAGRSLDEVACVGIGAPGPLDPDTGVILTTPNLPGWENYPLAPNLAAILGKPVFLDNDVKLGTLGEVRRGAGQGSSSVVGLFIGTGIGGGIVIGGRIHHGASKNASEIGHHTIDLNGPMCNCGVRGHLEALASRSAIERNLRRAIRQGAKSRLKRLFEEDERVTSGDLRRAYKKGDKLTRKVMHRVADHIGIGIANMLNIISPERVILGGGVMEAFGEILLDRIRRSTRRNCFEVASNATEIVLARLGDEAGVLGAAELAHDHLRKGTRKDD